MTAMKDPDKLLCILRRDGFILGGNQAWKLFLKHKFDHPPPAFLHDILLPEQENRWQRVLEKLRRLPGTSALFACRDRGGQVRYLHGRFSAGMPVLQSAIQASFRDITARYRDKQLCRQNLRTLVRMAANTRTAVALLDEQGQVRHWSRHAARLSGYNRSEVYRHQLPAILAPEQPTAIAPLQVATEPNRKTTAFTEGSHTLVCRRKDGTVRSFDFCVAPFSTGQRSYTAVLFTETAQISVNPEKIQQLAYYDPLTGLPSRALLNERLQQSLAEARRFKHPLAVLFLDLDHFKQVNDNLGHAVGDQVLKLAAKRLQDCLRGNDTVARFGGDEFIVVLSGFREAENMPGILRKIFASLAPEYCVEGHRIRLNASIGLALFPEDGQNPEQLLRHADTAMYVAKKEAGDSYRFFSPEMNLALLAQLELESQLRQAVGRKDFFLLFQPRLDLQTRQVVAVEALLRWRHPDGTPRNPESFLPRLEKLDLMVPLGEGLLQQACETCRTWQVPGRAPLPLAINLSASQFGHPGLKQGLVAALQNANLPAACLQLEVDESTLQNHENCACDILHDIGQLGLHWGLDNFGRDYISLQKLKDLPFDYLKIDRHFIGDLSSDQNDAAMVGAILAMARNLGLTPVAEGIETWAQHHLLLAMGCRQGQGHLFLKPCDKNTLASFLDDTPDQPAMPCRTDLAPPF
jgi:diguanylate cyclase (GGDEF)-like protein/PAS domain S-box-containing protein